jgi:O-antigen ligase
VIIFYIFVISAILFLFYIQNTKNGILYASIYIAIFLVLILFGASSVKFRKKVILFMLVVCGACTMVYQHLQKNDSWNTLISDARLGLKIEQNPQWKYAGEYGLPVDEYGRAAYTTNYMRVAWFKAGLQLAVNNPLGYGLVEDSFRALSRIQWPEASPSLSHSHSGWLDLLLGLGFPGLLLILGALFCNVLQSREVALPWRPLVFWGLMANFALWITTEVAATVPFSALIFWVSWASGLTLFDQSRND